VLLRPLGDVMGWWPMVLSTPHEIGGTDPVPGAPIDQICTGRAHHG
jgi:hypothetical protein